MDFGLPACGETQVEEAPQSQGRRAVRQAATEGRSEREVLRRLVDVLATLSLVNVAVLRGPELGTVFKTYLVPCAEPVAEAMAEAMAEAGRLYHDSAGAIKNKPEAERADAQEQLGPPFVYVWAAFLRSLAATKESRTRGSSEAVLGEQRVEERTSAVGNARSVLPREAVQERSRARKGGRASCSASIRLLSFSREHWRQHCGCRKGIRKYGPAPRGPLEREAARLLTQMRGK